jgi:TRAP-type C4-dicarboxylate transport system substrate-binding protein
MMKLLPRTRKLAVGLVAGGALSLALAGSAAAKELSLAYFMGPKHPMVGAVIEPFAKKLAELSGGKLTVRMYPGGALNSAPPKQYSMLLDGVADIAFGLSGYTGDLFPISNAISVPVAKVTTSVSGTEALWNAIDLVSSEYDAKVLAVWTNGARVLITRKQAVRTLEDMKGMKIRVTAATDVPFVEALGASPVAQPVTVINQNLQNGTIDGIIIDPSGIASFKLWEPANYITTNIPSGNSAFFLLMNKATYNGLSAEEKGWVDAASGKWLSLSGAREYDVHTDTGLEVARKNKVEVFPLSDAERARWDQALTPALAAYRGKTLKDGVTGAAVLDKMHGK